MSDRKVDGVVNLVHSFERLAVVGCIFLHVGEIRTIVGVALGKFTSSTLLVVEISGRDKRISMHQQNTIPYACQMIWHFLGLQTRPHEF